MPVHLIGSSAGSLVEVCAPLRFHALLHVPGTASSDGTFARARISCPRQGGVDGAECVDCIRLQAFRTEPRVEVYCAVDDREPIGRWMRSKPPATTVETRCHAADELAKARGVHHLLVFDRELQLVGVACRCDLTRDGALAVADVMSKDVFAAEPATTLGEAAAAMKQLRIGCLPVVAGALVVGVVTKRDLGRAGVPLERP